MKARTSRQVECTIPVLPVRDLARSIRFYARKLGFKLDWRGRIVCSVSRDGTSLMLRQKSAREKSARAWVWIGLSSDALFSELKKRRVKILQQPQNHEWGYDMMATDPDGNVLWLGTERSKIGHTTTRQCPVPPLSGALKLGGLRE